MSKKKSDYDDLLEKPAKVLCYEEHARKVAGPWQKVESDSITPAGLISKIQDSKLMLELRFMELYSENVVLNLIHTDSNKLLTKYRLRFGTDAEAQDFTKLIAGTFFLTGETCVKHGKTEGRWKKDEKKSTS